MIVKSAFVSTYLILRMEKNSCHMKLDDDDELEDDELEDDELLQNFKYV
jgi:hypothetical protein